MSLPSSRRLYAVWTRVVSPFWGVVNMLTFTDLRADYPLILTLLGPAYPCRLTWSYIARYISPHAIAGPPIRHNQAVPVAISTKFLLQLLPIRMRTIGERIHMGIDTRTCIASRVPTSFRRVIEVSRRTPVRKSARQDRIRFPANRQLPCQPKSAECAVVEVTCCCAAFTCGIRRR